MRGWAVESNNDTGTRVLLIWPAHPFTKEAPVLAPYSGRTPNESLRAIGNNWKSASNLFVSIFFHFFESDIFLAFQ